MHAQMYVGTCVYKHRCIFHLIMKINGWYTHRRSFTCDILRGNAHRQHSMDDWLMDITNLTHTALQVYINI